MFSYLWQNFTTEKEYFVLIHGYKQFGFFIT